MDCIFCKIIKREAPSDIVYETEDILVFKNIRPLAPVHLLVIPKKHIASVNEITLEDINLIGKLFLAAQKAAEKSNIKKVGYKIAINVEKGGGQEIYHLHLHLLGGWKNQTERDIPEMP